MYARWLAILQEYNFVMIYSKGSKYQNVDTLSQLLSFIRNKHLQPKKIYTVMEYKLVTISDITNILVVVARDSLSNGYRVTGPIISYL